MLKTEKLGLQEEISTEILLEFSGKTSSNMTEQQAAQTNMDLFNGLTGVKLAPTSGCRKGASNQQQLTLVAAHNYTFDMIMTIIVLTSDVLKKRCVNIEDGQI